LVITVDGHGKRDDEIPRKSGPLANWNFVRLE
jgi:hypothetical protein